MRGACCKIHRIQVDAGEQRRIARALRGAGDARADVMEKPLPQANGLEHLPMSAEEQCIFLGSDNRCDLRKFGARVHPSICQKFPYLSLLTPERHIFSLTMQCPTALELFAKEPSFEVVMEPEDSEPPSEHLIYLGAPDQDYVLGDGAKTDPKTFWLAHWEWFDRFRARPETSAIERLTRFAEEVTGVEAPSRAMVTPQQWTQSAFDGGLTRQLQRLTGKSVRGLAWLWLHLQEEHIGPLPAPNTDDDGVLTRYLMHRFHLPVGYIVHTDLRMHLATLFAMAVRYRIERARGSVPMLAVRHLDRLFVHAGGVTPILGAGAEPPAWEPLCALANAVTV